ncbi:hypothetical protein [Clostridium sp.]|nr:hypothetical protein [uncultured Clostridium sp.]
MSTEVEINTKTEVAHPGELKRSLQARHLNMIAIGGAIVAYGVMGPSSF